MKAGGGGKGKRRGRKVRRERGTGSVRRQEGMDGDWLIQSYQFKIYKKKTHRKPHQSLLRWWVC